MIDHDEQHLADALAKKTLDKTDVDGLPNDIPISVSVPNCYHCLAQRSRRRTQELHNSLVVKKYGSIVNTLNQSGSLHIAHLNRPHGEIELERRNKSNVEEKSAQEVANMTNFGEDIIHSVQTVQETTAYQGQKFDLIGFSEYFPFGLKQVYGAVSTLNQILNPSRVD